MSRYLFGTGCGVLAGLLTFGGMTWLGAPQTPAIICAALIANYIGYCEGVLAWGSR